MTRAAAIAAYLAGLLAVDTQVPLRGQLVLGAVTWLALIAAARSFPLERRAQVAVVVCAATLAEVTGSIIWGVYTYRLHNLPTFVPPAHGLVFVAGVALSDALRNHARALVAIAATAAAAWGVLGLSVLPRRDAAGAVGVPLLLAFLWRSRARAAYAGVFLVVACLELYGTAIGTWRWATELPGLGIPDGNPPSGVASGYVWFDVMGLLLAPRLLAALPTLQRKRRNPPHRFRLRNVRPRRSFGAPAPPQLGAIEDTPTIAAAARLIRPLSGGSSAQLTFPLAGERAVAPARQS
jgi:hypothetical protein